MRLFSGLIGLLALAIAVAGTVVTFLFFLSYRTGLNPNANLLLCIVILTGGVWLVERAWRKIIGATGDE